MIYVGSSGVSIKYRFSGHISYLKRGSHHNRKLQNAWDKYGSEAFKFTILEEVTDLELLIYREQYWIDKLNACNRKIGYNILPKAFRQIRESRTVCINCDRDNCKKTRKGRCGRCSEFFRRNGYDRPKISIDLRTHVKNKNIKAHCRRCKRKNSVVGYGGKGLCKSCYRNFGGNKKQL